jgi:hypothetical protein
MSTGWIGLLSKERLGGFSSLSGGAEEGRIPRNARGPTTPEPDGEWTLGPQLWIQGIQAAS